MLLTERQKRNLRKQVESLYGRIAKLEAERDALKARLAEVEAQAAEMRAAVEATGLVGFLDRLESRYGAMNDDTALITSALVTDLYHLSAGCIRRLKTALSSDAGGETAERLRLLEELADVATAFVEYCTLVECLPHSEDAICDQDPCLRQRLKAVVRKLRGGQDNAGTSA